jgi:phage shock protein A
MRRATAYLLWAALVFGAAELVRWEVAEDRASKSVVGAEEVVRLRNNVEDLKKQVDLMRDELRAAKATSANGGQECSASRAIDPAPVAPAAAKESRPDPISHQLGALLWRCLHDRDGVMERLEKQGLSPFDPGVQELVEEAFYRIDDLRALARSNLESAQHRRSIADGLENDIRSGAVKSADLSRLQQEIDRLRNSDDFATRELETALSGVLDDLSQQLSENRPR